jgi:tryptophan-rich hypothetical protein
MAPVALSPKKLLHTKWTAVAPQRNEKHFVVTRVVEPEPRADAGTPAIEFIELQAVHSKRVRVLQWRALTDASVWKRGWV